jgi:cell division septation protein DedD
LFREDFADIPRKMLSILEQDPLKAAAPVIESPEAEVPESAAEPAEFEIVLGRAQIASWLFVMVIAIAVCSSLAYLAGKSAVVKKTVATAPAVITPPAPSVPPPAATTAMPTASILVPPKTDMASILKTAGQSGPPLFAEPEAGKVYIQIGAVEKGMATILAEGLRSHGFDAFVGVGPNDKIFRVLIGPLPDPESFRQAKAAVDAIDLTAFARKYEK